MFKYAAEMRGDQKGSLVRWDGTGSLAYERDKSRPPDSQALTDDWRWVGLNRNSKNKVITHTISCILQY